MMANNGFQTINTCQNKVLAHYQAKIRQQQQVLTRIKEILPAHLAEHVQHCVLSAKKCLLYADTEAVATQLRLYLPIILQTLQNAGIASLELIQVRLTEPPVPSPQNRVIKKPSQQTKNLIRDNLQTIADEELKAALRRLSQTLDRLS